MLTSTPQYRHQAADYAKSKGIIIADTKFEFGVDENGTLILADEVLTPGKNLGSSPPLANPALIHSYTPKNFTLDSSRFWPADKYAIGRGQPSYDKQYVRDYLTSINFDKKNGVELPKDVVDNTLEKYVEAFTILTGGKPVL